MIRRFLNSIAARRLAKRGADVRHERILSVARAMRSELGLPADRRLA